jgi:hypothetical protein
MPAVRLGAAKRNVGEAREIKRQAKARAGAAVPAAGHETACVDDAIQAYERLLGIGELDDTANRWRA